MKNHDITKTESGLQQYDRVGKTREPEIGYQDGDRLKANDIGDRSASADRLMNDAQRAATDNRRDQATTTGADFESPQDSRPSQSHIGGRERGRDNSRKH
jgi:hypothetical protein